MGRTKRTLREFLEDLGHTRESRNFLITDEAWYGFKAVARKRGHRANIGEFMEKLSEELQMQYLTEEERQQVKADAQLETNKNYQNRLARAGYSPEEN